MKRLFFILLAISILLAPVLAQASDLNLTPEEEAWLEEHPTVRLTGDPDWLPQEAFTEDGKYIGVVPNVLDLLESRLGITFERVPPTTWSDAVRMAESGEVDILSETAGVDRKGLTFTDPHLVFPVVIVTQANSPALSPETLYGKRVAVVRDYGYVQIFQKEYQDLDYVVVETVSEGLLSVSSGEADAFLVSTSTASYLISELGLTNLKFSGYTDLSIDLALGIRDDWPILVDVINKALATITIDERAAITKSWLGEIKPYEEQSQIRFSPEEIQWLEEHPVINVHNELDWPPFNFNENRQPKGYSIDYMDLLAEKVGLEVGYVSGPSWGEFLDLIKNKELDVMLNIVNTEDRREYILFTEPYLHTVTGIYVKDGEERYGSLAGLDGKIISLPKGFFEQELLERYYPNINLHLVRNNREALEAVLTGKADVAIGETAVMTYIMVENSITGISISGTILDSRFDNVLNIGVRDDWPILRSIMQKAMEDVSLEEKRALQKKWVVTEKITIDLTAEEKAWLAEHKDDIRMGVDPAFAPFESITEEGEYMGICADYVELIAERLGIPLEPVPNLSWAEVIDKSKQNEINVLPCVGITEERKQWLAYTDAHTSFPRVIITQTSSDVQSIDDLDDLRVGVHKDSSHHGFINEQTTLEPILYNTFQDAMLALSTNEVDAVIGNLPVSTHTIQTMKLTNLKIAALASTESFPLAIAVRKDWPELVSIFNKALDSISTETKIEINSKWVTVEYAQDLIPVVGIELTPEEEAWLAEHKEMRLGVEPNWPPVEFVDDFGEYEGMCSDYVAIISDLLGVNMIPQTGVSTWDEMIQKAGKGEIDVIPCIVKTEERSERFLFSKPYLTLPNVLVTRDDAELLGDFSDMEGKTIAIIRGYSTEELLARDYPGIIQIPVDDFDEALTAVSEGRVDGTLATFVSLKYTSQQLGITNLQISATTPYDIELAFAVRKDWPELVGMIDRALESISDPKKKDIQDKWVATRVEERLVIPIWVWFALGIALIFLALAFIAIMSVRESEQMYKTLVDKSPIPTSVLDTNGINLSVNRAFVRSTGFLPKDIIGKHFGEFVSKDYLNSITAAFNRVVGGGTSSMVVVEMTTKSGVKKLFEVRVEKLKKGGKDLMVAVLIELKQTGKSKTAKKKPTRVKKK